jgi:hypothetical protein
MGADSIRPLEGGFFMPMPMQISLDELMSALFARVDALSMNDENNRSKFNIVVRALYKKGILADEDILQSVRDEHHMLKELGLIPSEPSEDVNRAIADGILQWIKGDTAAIRKSMEEYEKRMQQAAAQEARSSKLTVASGDVLQRLDKLGGAPRPGGSGSKLII